MCPSKCSKCLVMERGRIASKDRLSPANHPSLPELASSQAATVSWRALRIGICETPSPPHTSTELCGPGDEQCVTTERALVDAHH